MRRTEALQGVRMAMFLNLLNRWELAELNQEEAAELLGVSERTFRRWTRRYEEEGEAGLIDRQARQGVGPASSDGPGGGSGAALPRALPGFYGQAFPRASDQGSRLRLGLHLAQAASAMGGRCAEGAAQGAASAQARAAAVAGDDAAPGDGPRHAWLEGQAALDLIVTMDDATGAIYSAFLVEEEGGLGLDLPGA